MVTDVALLAVAVVFVLLLAEDLVHYQRTGFQGYVGQDFTVYQEATSRWLAGGPFYLPHQIAGPYDISHGDVLYPPTAIPLFAAFLVLPDVLWWAVPIAGITAVFVWSRPTPAVLAVTAVCLWFPATPLRIITGNPVIWVVLCVALAGRWPAFGPWALLKPSLFPFAVVGMRRRAWWVSAGVMVGLLILLLPLTVAWVIALANSRNPSGLLYSLQDVPLMMIGVLAWLSRYRRLDRRDAVTIGPAESSARFVGSD
jgi:hypothetical protein